MLFNHVHLCLYVYIYIYSNFIYIQNYSTVAISIPGPFGFYWAESPGLLQVLQGSGGATGEIKMGRTGENYPNCSPWYSQQFSDKGRTEKNLVTWAVWGFQQFPTCLMFDATSEDDRTGLFLCEELKPKNIKQPAKNRGRQLWTYVQAS